MGVILDPVRLAVFIIGGRKGQFQMCIWMGARLPQRLKSTFFDIFSHSAGPFGATPFEKIYKKR